MGEEILESLTASENDDPFALQPKQASPKPVQGNTAMGGKKVVIQPSSPFPAWPDTASQDRNDSINDPNELSYSDLEAVNKDLLRLRIRMNNIRRDMRNAGREAVEAKMQYLRAFRRALIQQSGGSAEMRKAAAELLCEELETDMVMKQQVADEYASLFRATRDDLDNVKTVAFNLRALYQNI